MMKNVLFSLACIFSGLGSVGQTNMELMNLGDEAMAAGQYTNAVHYYAYILFKYQRGEEGMYHPYEITNPVAKVEKTEDGGIKPPDSPSSREVKLIHKLADAYRLAGDYTNAELWYTSAIASPHIEFPYSRFFYGISLQYNEKYEEAMVQFEQFQTELGDPDNKYYALATDKMASCQFALNPENTKNELRVVVADSLINEGSTSFGLQYTSHDFMIFSSARLSHLDSGANPMEYYLLDIYMVKRNLDSTWQKPEKFPFQINTKDFHEGCAAISHDGNTLFLTKMDPDHRNETKIYCSRKFNGIWLDPFLMDAKVNMDGFRSMSPFISADGKSLYFSSNRPGGEGGMDIWVTTLGEHGETSEAQNIGNHINTADDEISPFFHTPTSTLYFSSGGHIGFGGKDIFAAKWNEDTDWFGNSVNVGAPINSSRDDSYFVVDDFMLNGFVTSDRQSCTECDSVYNLSVHCNKIYEFHKPAIKFKISGHVYDIATNEVIPNATVEFKDISYKWEHFDVICDANGYYEHELIPNLELFLKAHKTDYFADQTLVATLGETESKDIVQDFYLEKIPKGEIVIEGIEYDFDKATLRPISMEILDNLIKFLELNDNLKIEIGSHTDERGGHDYNMKLSGERAQSVVTYLIDHGIAETRLVPKGYGEVVPAEVPDAAGVIQKLTPDYIYGQPKPAQDALHQRNRRTAFFVLEQ